MAKKRPESAIQQAIVKAAKRWKARESDPAIRTALDLLHAIPNGGSRHPGEAMRLKLEGVRPGIPDLLLPWPVEPYAGLYLEVKTTKGRLSKVQASTIEALRSVGYAVAVVRTEGEALAAIRGYMRGDHDAEAPA